MYFPDLTPYQYARTEPQPDVLNIGWPSSSAEQPFSRAAPDPRFVAALRRLIASPVNLFRGSHRCELCPEPPAVLLNGHIPMPVSPPCTTGNGEIRVTNKGTTYVAPVLVLHYVLEHHYRPPEEFIDAVLAAV